MLKTIVKSSNKKLGGCAATYRAGEGNVYSTCPSTCVLKPPHPLGSSEINREYLDAVLRSVPPKGVAWTYTHFKPASLLRATNVESPSELQRSNLTTVNISTDSLEEAQATFNQGWPTVTVVPHTRDSKVDRLPDGTRLVRCPAEYQDGISCYNCGGDTPLCARKHRNYIIKFTAHGVKKKTIEIRSQGSDAAISGGCYGDSGPTRLVWEKTKGETQHDASTLLTFVSSLPEGTKLRHHVVGDIGG